MADAASFADTTKKYSALLSLDAEFAKKDFNDELLQNRDIDVKLRPLYKFVLSGEKDMVSYALSRGYENPLMTRMEMELPVGVKVVNESVVLTDEQLSQAQTYGWDGSGPEHLFVRALYENDLKRFNAALAYYSGAIDADCEKCGYVRNVTSLEQLSCIKKTKYYIGETYFSGGYMLIANRGGNNNSIGIESCINDGTDIYYTWQKTAKLVANLLYNNNLTFDDVKQHHYYSGKNCPQTMRMNGMWPYFMELVKVEYEAIELMKEGYKFKLLVNDECVNELGRVNFEENKTVKEGVVINEIFSY